MSPTQLSIRKLSKTFPGVRALRDVDLDVEPGEVHALVGANGSGKSTLLKILAGRHRPDAGATATVRGEPFALGTLQAARRAGLRFVHQDPGIVMNLDAADNFALGGGYHQNTWGRIRWRSHRAAVRAAVESLGFDIDVGRPLRELTASQRTGVAIARAIHGVEAGSALLVLDEPTASLPSRDVETLFGVIRRVQSQGVAVIYVSHHLDEVFAVSDRVTVLRDGRRVDTYRTGDLDHQRLVEAMVGTALNSSSTAPAGRRGSVALDVDQISGRVVSGLDLEVRAGEIVGVAGLTGSGREELLSLLFGGAPRRGIVRVDGTTLPPMRPDLAVRARVGYVPGDRRNQAMLPLSVLENLTIAGLEDYWKGGRLRRSAERQDGRRLLGRLTVHPIRPDAALADLSGGNQQKVILGRWLRLEPAVLLLDEPTQGVDVAAKQEIYSILEAAAEAGTAVVVCSSDDDELERLCHRVLVMSGGRVKGELAGASLSASRIAYAALGVDQPRMEAQPA